MGEIAEMMLDGTLCEGCGCALDGESPGYPRKCKSCKRDDAPKGKPRSSKADLPQWKNEANDCISVRYHCNSCLRNFPTEGGARDHVHTMHPKAAS